VALVGKFPQGLLFFLRSLFYGFTSWMPGFWTVTVTVDDIGGLGGEM